MTERPSKLCLIEGSPPVARCLSLTETQKAKLRVAFKGVKGEGLSNLGGSSMVAVLSGRRVRPGVLLMSGG